MWKRKRQAEWLPWYRAREYKGDLTEGEKRQLDAFRMEPKHPAAEYDDLPEEVRNYIGRIELELYDNKQDWAVAKALSVSAIGAALLFINYKGWTDAAVEFVFIDVGLFSNKPIESCSVKFTRDGSLYVRYSASEEHRESNFLASFPPSLSISAIPNFIDGQSKQ